MLTSNYDTKKFPTMVNVRTGTMTGNEVIMFIFVMMVMLMRLIVTCRQASQGWALVMISSGLPLPVVTSSSLSSKLVLSYSTATKKQDFKLLIRNTFS